MAIKINWQDLYKRMVGNTEVQKVMLNGGEIRPSVWPTPVTKTFTLNSNPHINTTGSSQSGDYPVWDTITLLWTPVTGYEAWWEVTQWGTTQTINLPLYSFQIYDDSSATPTATLLPWYYRITYGNVEWATFVTDKYAYNASTLPITLDSASRVGYEWLWWIGSNGRTPEKVVVIPVWTTWNLTYYSVWRANTNTPYTVNHWLQNQDLQGYTLHESDTLHWTTDTYTQATANTYVGYTLHAPIQQELIKGDGSTVINIYYDLI